MEWKSFPLLAILSYLRFYPIAAGICNICKMWPHKSQYNIRTAFDRRFQSVSTSLHQIKITYWKTTTTRKCLHWAFLYSAPRNSRTYRPIQPKELHVSFQFSQLSMKKLQRNAFTPNFYCWHKLLMSQHSRHVTRHIFNSKNYFVHFQFTISFGCLWKTQVDIILLFNEHISFWISKRFLLTK